jgi:hypothetical protein
MLRTSNSFSGALPTSGYSPGGGSDLLSLSREADLINYKRESLQLSRNINIDSKPFAPFVIDHQSKNVCKFAVSICVARVGFPARSIADSSRIRFRLRVAGTICLYCVLVDIMSLDGLVVTGQNLILAFDETTYVFVQAIQPGSKIKTRKKKFFIGKELIGQPFGALFEQKVCLLSSHAHMPSLTPTHY